MKLFPFLAILALGVGLISGLRLSGEISAANPPFVSTTQPNSDLFTYNGESLQKYSADNAALKQTGVWRWRFVDVSGCNSESIRPAVTAAVAEASRMGIQVVEADSDPTAHAIYGDCGVSFSSACGGPPVIGCLGDGFPYVNTVRISTDMNAYFDVSQRAIALHEVVGHAMAVWNEQYILGGSFANSSDVTIMNTGPLSRHDLGPDEDARWWRTMGSPELKTLGYGNNGSWFVYACNFDANASRLSVLVDRHDGRGIVWAGVIRPIAPDRNGCQGIGEVEGLNIVVGNVYYLKQESPASYLVAFNEARVP